MASSARSPLPGRFDRRSGDTRSDNREAGQRDRDRILYTTAFQRLAEVTQVVSPDEGHVFHNRLTHSLKVAQVARRLAEKLLKDSKQAKIADDLGGIDPDVVEAAALAHDLGHPPFGHIAEDELRKLMEAVGATDGFEGNAQSFRIVTKLAMRSAGTPGLDLTRATLNALLKYPWLRGKGPKTNKWGAYESEKAEFEWARELMPEGSFEKSPEAGMMDWADDVTYAVHDVMDFFSAGIVPLHRLASSGDKSERREFFTEVFRRLAGQPLPFERVELEKAFEKAVESLPFDRNYKGTREERALLRNWSAVRIREYIHAVELRSPTGADPKRVAIDPDREKEVFMLQQLTWHYVIQNPALATQQAGQRKMIRDLFDIYYKAATKGSNDDSWIFPFAYREELQEVDGDPVRSAWVVCDLIASMTERQVHQLYLRLTGVDRGSALS